MSQFCAFCGKPIPEGTHFCPYCGAEIDNPGKNVQSETDGLEKTKEQQGSSATVIPQAAEQDHSYQNDQQTTRQFAQEEAPDPYSFEEIKKNIQNGPVYFSTPDCSWKDFYLRYHGRISRETYIKRYLLLLAAGIIVVIILALLSGVPNLFLFAVSHINDVNMNFFGAAGVLYYVVTIIFDLISTPISIRRAHDLDLPGWLALVEYLPYVGVIATLFLLCKKGTTGPNRFGPDPLQKS
jgi:uncharacterized membrane protein YhaH (DUF805 family)